MSKFTPGKWETLGFGGVAIIDRDARTWKMIADLAFGEITKENTEEIMANTRLVSAAPDMYEALQETLDFIEDIISRKCPECTQDAEDMREFLEELLARIDGTEATHD